MKKAEIILSLIALSAMIMKLCLVPGINILIVLSLSSLSCFYFYAGFAFFNGLPLKKTDGNAEKKVSQRREAGGIVTGIAMGMALMGMLFRFQSYPGATQSLALGLFGLGGVIAVSVAKYIKTRDEYYSNILKRVVVYFIICLTLYLVPRNTFFEFVHRDHPAYVKAMEKSWDNPGNEALQDSVDVARERK